MVNIFISLENFSPVAGRKALILMGCPFLGHNCIKKSIRWGFLFINWLAAAVLGQIITQAGRAGFSLVSLFCTSSCQTCSRKAFPACSSILRPWAGMFSLKMELRFPSTVSVTRTGCVCVCVSFKPLVWRPLFQRWEKDLQPKCSPAFSCFDLAVI